MEKLLETLLTDRLTEQASKLSLAAKSKAEIKRCRQKSQQTITYYWKQQKIMFEKLKPHTVLENKGQGSVHHSSQNQSSIIKLTK